MNDWVRRVIERRLDELELRVQWVTAEIDELGAQTDSKRKDLELYTNEAEQLKQSLKESS